MLRMQDRVSAHHINFQRSLFRLTHAQNIQKTKKKKMTRNSQWKFAAEKKIVAQHLLWLTASAALATAPIRYELSVHFVLINNLLLERDSVFMTWTNQFDSLIDVFLFKLTFHFFFPCLLLLQIVLNFKWRTGREMGRGRTRKESPF